MWVNLEPDDLTFVQTHVSACNYFLAGFQSTGNFGQSVILLTCLHGLFTGDVLVIFLFCNEYKITFVISLDYSSAAVQ